MSDRPYSRLYWSLIADEDFENVYDDDRAFACWCRLLMLADQSWPAPAPMPASASRKSVAILVGAGLVILQPGGRYRIRGLEEERKRRQDAAAKAAGVRWQSGPQSARNAGAFHTEMPRREEKRKDKTSTPRADDGDGYDQAVAWLASKKAWVDSPKLQVELARMIDRRNAETVIAAMDAVPNAETAAQYIFGARNALFPLRGTVVEKEPDRAQENFDRGVERTQRMLRQVYREADA